MAAKRMKRKGAVDDLDALSALADAHATEMTKAGRDKPDPKGTVNGFTINKDFEGTGSLVIRAFAVASKATRRGHNPVPIGVVTPEELAYAVPRMRAAGWDVRVDGEHMILTDRPRR